MTTKIEEALCQDYNDIDAFIKGLDVENNRRSLC